MPDSKQKTVDLLTLLPICLLAFFFATLIAMNTTQLNQYFSYKALSQFTLALLVALCVVISTTGVANAQNIEQVRWKSTDQVRAVYGEPKSISSPVGTHASYMLWKYPDFTIAFANNRAFHLFNKDSLKKFVIDENRDQ